MLEIKNTETVIKNVFNGQSSKLDVAEKRIAEFENTSMKTSNWK